MTTWTDFVYSTNGNFDDTTVAALKANAPGVKIMAAVGGWANDNDFRPIAADASLRQKFAKNCTSFIESWGLDGIDLDWE
jgi:chitinase